MCADFGAFFDNANADLGALARGLLLQPYRRRQPSRAGTDDNDIVFH